MKTKLLALTLAGATAFAFTPKPALASHDNTGAAIIGGVIGGLVIGSMIADHDDARVVVASHRDHRDGYWKIVEVRTWVPGHWIVERSHHGRSYRRYVEGHYECRNDRVWVAYDRRGYRDGREIGRGYGHDRYDNDRYDHDGRRDYRR
jgi:hypothetical protein